MTPNHSNRTDESTGLNKRGTAAATALVAGAGISATAGNATAQETQETQEVVLKANHYYPNEEFVILTNFEERNRIEFLEEYDEGEDVFDDHGDWDVYSALVEVGEPGGRIVILLIDNDVDPNPGDRGTMDDSPSFWNVDWDLINVDATFNDDDDPDDNDETDTDTDTDAETEVGDTNDGAEDAASG